MTLSVPSDFLCCWWHSILGTVHCSKGGHFNICSLSQVFPSQAGEKGGIVKKSEKPTVVVGTVKMPGCHKKEIRVRDRWVEPFNGFAKPLGFNTFVQMALKLGGTVTLNLKGLDLATPKTRKMMLRGVQ